jgi:transposase-like protein
MPVPAEPYFQDERKAFEYLESIVWAEGIACPHCGAVGGRVYALEGKSTRMGLKKCGECRKQFTVKVGTMFEHARLPLHKLLQAVYLVTCSEKSASAQELHRSLGITYKSAWFLAHRIRDAIPSRRRSSVDQVRLSKILMEAARSNRVVRRAASPKRDSSRGTDPRRVSPRH